MHLGEKLSHNRPKVRDKKMPMRQRDAHPFLTSLAFFFLEVSPAQRAGRVFDPCGLIQWHCHWIKSQIQVQGMDPLAGIRRTSLPC
jgi:hypothetical protein